MSHLTPGTWAANGKTFGNHVRSPITISLSKEPGFERPECFSELHDDVASAKQKLSAFEFSDLRDLPVLTLLPYQERRRWP